MSIWKYSASELSECIQRKQVSVSEVADEVLRQIEKREDNLHCYITFDKEWLYKQAQEIQEHVNKGRLQSPLVGVPIAIKDNICVKDLPTTCGSKMLSSFYSTYDATVIRRLKQAGALLVGKTNMDEFAMGSTTETSFFGVTKNPHYPEYVPGGSSGGSAAAVTAKECFMALGTDTGGSVRQPASHCGIVGLKPTYGRVSRYGLVAYASSMDQIGPMARTVEDAWVLFHTIAGYDAKDSTSTAGNGMDYTNMKNAINNRLAAGNMREIRIGIPKEYFQDGLQEDVKYAVLLAAKELEKAGATVEEFSLGITDEVAAYYVLAMAEASSNLARYDGVKYGYRTNDYEGLDDLYKKSRAEGFGEEVKRRILMGTYVLQTGYYDAYYQKALTVRRQMEKLYQEAFRKYDVILGPTAPTTAPLLGSSLQQPLQMYMNDLYTVGANLTKIPAISIPCGTDSKGLPIGLQLQAKEFEEEKLMQVAYAYEKLRNSNRTGGTC